MLCIALAWMLAAAACEKEVKLNLKSAAGRIVVEGGIETDRPPVVVLTNTFSFFSRIDFNTLQNAFINDAVVTVSDGTEEVTLERYTLDSTGFDAPISFYSLSTSDFIAGLMIGEEGKSYRLRIQWKGATYESVTTIPPGIALDSVWARKPAREPDAGPDARELVYRYTDPDTLGNSVRVFTQRNSLGYYPALGGGVYTDDVVNGTGITADVAPGAPPGTAFTDSSAYFFRGDTATIRWCTVDRAVYDFYNTLEFAKGAVGNPFSSPIQVQSNISNGGLGVWAGYGARYHTLVIRD